MANEDSKTQWNIQNVPETINNNLRIELINNPNYKHQYQFVIDAVKEKIEREVKKRNEGK